MSNVSAANRNPLCSLEIQANETLVKSKTNNVQSVTLIWLNGKDELKATAPAYYNQLNYNSNWFFPFFPPKKSVQDFFLERVTTFREIVKLKFSTKNVGEVFSMKARSGQNCIINFFLLVN